MTRPSLVLSVALAGLAAVAAPVAAQTVSIGAAADNTLYEDPTGALSNGIGQHFFSGATAEVSARRGLLAFDVAAALPAGATVTGVTLTLNMSRGGPVPTQVALHRVLADWGEGTTDAGGSEGAGGPATPESATWLHRFHDTALWSTPGGDFEAGLSAEATIGGVGAYSWSSAGMVSDVQAWLDGSAGNFGWVLIGNEGTESSSRRFDSRENPDISVRPVLTVQYIPAPGAGAIAIGGLIAAGRRRRR